MISRRKILSKSLDNLDSIAPAAEEEEDVWYDTEKLCKDHIQEVLSKWTQIDDEIWAKVIVFEKNRRVAKAYARSPIITINGSKHGFDGVRIGLNGFDNPMRDSKTADAKKSIGDGFKIKMDDTGCILVKRYGKSNVYVHKGLQNSNEETVIGAEIQKLPNQTLEIGKSVKLFDMKKFSLNINREFSRSYPDRSRLERQCLSAISLVKTNDNLLNCPIWILVVNIVAIDMLKSKMMAFPKIFGDNINETGGGTMMISSSAASSSSMIMDINNKSSIANSEDPYSTIDSQAELLEQQQTPLPVTTNTTMQQQQQQYPSSSNKIPSKYEDRPETSTKFKSNSEISPYHDKKDNKQSTIIVREKDQTQLKHRRNYYQSQQQHQLLQQQQQQQQQQKSQNRKKQQDDPYYCGLLARIPNFIRSTKQYKKKEPSTRMMVGNRKISAHHISHPIPIAAFHQYAYPGHYPYKLYPHHHPISLSQFSLWDSKSMVGGID